MLLVVLPVSLFPWVHFPHLAPFFAPVPRAFPLSPPFGVPWWCGVVGALGNADGPRLGVGGLEPRAEGCGAVGGAQALKNVPEERFLCALRHGGLQGSVVGVVGGAGEEFLQGMEAVVPQRRLAPRAHLTQRRSSGRAREDQQARSGGGLGGGLRARGPGAAAAGAGDGGHVSVLWGARIAGPVVPVVRGGKRGHGVAAA